MLKFYDIDKEYINFLKTFDKQVPNIAYSSNNKFVCGIVLEVNGIKYYAPISHKTDKQHPETPFLYFIKQPFIY